MSKINTAEIKKALDNKFGKNKYIRLKKRKFEYFNSRINFNGNNDIILNGKLNYRIFTDDSGQQPRPKGRSLKERSALCPNL